MTPTIIHLSNRFFSNRSGATAIEYALIAAVMAGLIVIALAVLDLEGTMQGVQDTLDSAS